jgi:hypothetical protein
MPRKLTIALAAISFVLPGVLAAGCARKSVSAPPSPPASAAAGGDVSATSAKDAPNTAQLEKPE